MARPRKEESDQLQYFPVRLPLELIEWLRREAKLLRAERKRLVTPSALVREILEAARQSSQPATNDDPESPPRPCTESETSDGTTD